MARRRSITSFCFSPYITSKLINSDILYDEDVRNLNSEGLCEGNILLLFFIIYQYKSFLFKSY